MIYLRACNNIRIQIWAVWVLIAVYRLFTQENHVKGFARSMIDSRVRIWDGHIIDPRDLNQNGAFQVGCCAYFDCYDGKRICPGYCLTFKTHDRASDFVKWYYKEKPFDYSEHFVMINNRGKEEECFS